MRIAFLLLLSLSVQAQLPVVPLQTFVANTAPVQNLTNISLKSYYWWVSSDVPVTATVSNQWIDRVHGFATSQSTVGLRPTNSVIGMRFDSGKNLITPALSVGGVPSGTSPGWLTLLVNADVPSGSPSVHGIISARLNGQGVSIDNSKDLEYTSTACSGGPNVVGPSSVKTAGYLDITIVYTTTNTTWYTNGTAFVTNTSGCAVCDFFAMDTFGTGNQGFNGAWAGYLTEAFGATNEFPTTLQLSNTHKYLTNTYSYSP